MKKIAVYTICKNEEDNIIEWINNVKDADYIIVGDTGSSDDSIKLLKQEGVKVYNLDITPWRFDEARNKILEKVPQDVYWCISLDFDERLDKNFINKLKNQDINLYNSVTSTIIDYDSSNNLKSKTIICRIHSRYDYEWKNAVHEKLVYKGTKEKKIKFNQELIIYHYPDHNKDRSEYLELIQLATKENNSFKFKYQSAIEHLKQSKLNEGLEILCSIKLEDLTDEETSTLLRMIARTNYHLGEFETAIQILKKSIVKYNYCSSNYTELIIMLYEQKKYIEILELEPHISKIDFEYKSIYNDYFDREWLIYDLLSIAHYYFGDLISALDYCKKAHDLNPTNERISGNLKYYEKVRLNEK